MFHDESKNKKKRIANRNYYLKNKGKILKNVKERAKKNDYHKNYYQRNKEKYVAYRENNHEKIKQYYKDYASKNRASLKQYHREYNLRYGYTHIKQYAEAEKAKNNNLLNDRSRTMQSLEAAEKLVNNMLVWRENPDETNQELKNWTRCAELFYEYALLPDSKVRDKHFIKMGNFQEHEENVIIHSTASHLYFENKRFKFLEYIRKNETVSELEKTQISDTIEIFYELINEWKNDAQKFTRQVLKRVEIILV